MIINSVAISLLQTNCYLLVDEKSGEAAVIDPGKYNDALINMLAENGVDKLKYILLTHGHYDHMLGVAALHEAMGGSVAIHEADAVCLEDAESALAKSSIARNFVPTKADIVLTDGSLLSLGDTQIRVLHTPGHTAGSVCYLFDSTIMSGDTLFMGSVGRTDLPTGSVRQMKESLAKLTGLEGDFRVYPGHGEPTTLSYERQHNPYL